MTDKASGSDTFLPETGQEAANWLRMLAREINTFVLFLQTWSAMGFLVDPGVVSSLVELQSKIIEARSRLRAATADEDFEEMRAALKDIALREEETYRDMMQEIKRFKEESEDIFPALKMNFDPCF